MTILDAFVPSYQFAEHHSTHVVAAPERAYRSVRELDLSDSFTVRALFALRGLPTDGLRLERATEMGFVQLGEEPGREWVLGLIAQPWRLLRGETRSLSGDDFRNFEEPGFARVGWNFRVEPHGAGAEVSTETRIDCSDDQSRRRFGRYWRVIRPFSGWVRLLMLALVKAAAEKATRSSESPGS